MHQAASLRMQSEQPLIVNSSKKKKKYLKFRKINRNQEYYAAFVALSLKAADYWLIREKMGYLPVDYDDADLL